MKPGHDQNTLYKNFKLKIVMKNNLDWHCETCHSISYCTNFKTTDISQPVLLKNQTTVVTSLKYLSKLLRAWAFY